MQGNSIILQFKWNSNYLNKFNTSSLNFKLQLGLFLIAIGVYANTFNHQFVLDDDIVFVKNKFVQDGISGIPEILSHGFLYGFNGKNDQSYRPLVLINLAIDKSLFGNNPSAHHKINVLYFAILCVLLFRFLNVLFKKEKPWIAFWITLLFALHPIHTEVVANIKGRDEILHAIFLVVSFMYSFKYIEGQNVSALLIALFCYFAALLCKEMAVTYIALLPLTIWFFRSIEIKRITKITLPFLAPLLLYFGLRNAVLDTVTFDEKMTVLNNGLAAATNYSDQLATNFLIFGNYIKLLFLPHPLSWDYTFPTFPIVSFSNPVVILVVSLFLFALVFSLIGLKSKNKLAFAFLFFIISFSIVSNFFILIGSTLGERLLFFPSIAFCIFAVLGIKKLLNAFLPNQPKLLAVVLLLVGISYSFKTIDRNKDWKSNSSLFIAGAEATPNNTRALSALGTVYRELGEQSTNQQQQQNYYLLAIENYQKSIDLYDENRDSHYNLGVIYLNTNQIEKAKEKFEITLKLDENNVNALNNLGVIYFRNQQYKIALEYFNRCLAINPDFQNANANLGAVYHNLGEYAKARKYYRIALELNPADQSSRSNLSKLPQ